MIRNVLVICSILICGMAWADQKPERICNDVSIYDYKAYVNPTAGRFYLRGSTFREAKAPKKLKYLAVNIKTANGESVLTVDCPLIEREPKRRWTCYTNGIRAFVKTRDMITYKFRVMGNTTTITPGKMKLTSRVSFMCNTATDTSLWNWVSRRLRTY